MAVSCLNSISHAGTHGLQTSINFDASGTNIAELGVASWATWGGSVDASTATDSFSFWVQSSAPVTIANLYICEAGGVPEIGNAVNLAIPGDGLWHQYTVPIAVPVPPSPWTFVQGAAPWNNNPLVAVFF